MATRVANRRTMALAGPPEVEDPTLHVYIGRPTVYGNPFHIGRDGDRDAVLLKYWEWFYAQARKSFRAEVRRELKDKVLVCWCAPAKCHGDVIAAYCDATTINQCPECGKREIDPDPVAGILHRTRLCSTCYPTVREQFEPLEDEE